MTFSHLIFYLPYFSPIYCIPFIYCALSLNHLVYLFALIVHILIDSLVSTIIFMEIYFQIQTVLVFQLLSAVMFHMHKWNYEFYI